MTNESWKNPWKVGSCRDGSRDRHRGRDGPGRGELCNQAAAAQAGQRENTKDTVIAGAIGAVAGAAVGAAGGAVLLAGAVPARVP